jgi:hypothetical protein
MFLPSCQKHYKTFDVNDITKIRDESRELSLTTVPKEEYWMVFRQLNDSIQVWEDNKLRGHDVDYEKTALRFVIDSVLCFNKKGNKMITCRLLSGNGRENKDGMDGIAYYFGIKIKDKWYFSGGPTMYIPRSNYQKDIHKPLSLDLLKQIATDRIYRRYLTRKFSGEREINDHFFEDLEIRDAYNYPFTTQKAWEESWIRLSSERWKSKKF